MIYVGTIDLRPYFQDRNKYSTNLKIIDAARRKMERLELKIPGDLEEELRRAKSLYDEAEENFSPKNRRKTSEDTQKTLEGMQKAAELTSTVLDKICEFYFNIHDKKVRKVRKYFKGREDLAEKRIPNYSTHKKNFRIIEKRRKNSEKLSWDQVSSDCERLRSFLDAFESVKEELAAEINKEKRANRFRWINIVAIIVAALAGGGLGWFLSHFRQVDQPETEVQSEATNPTP